MIDTHAHIAMDGYDGGVEGLLARAAVAGVTHIVAIGAGGTADEAEDALAVAKDNVGVSAICGIHPHDAKAIDDPLWWRIESICAAAEVVAVGETGLDYHYDMSPREVQAAAFQRHVELALLLKKPLCIHTRNAELDTLRILRDTRAQQVGGVIHCFSGTTQFALAALDLGFLLSIPGIVTFAKPGDLHEVVQLAPLDKLLIETDSPFLAPVPFRGKRNEPALVAHTLHKVAELKGISVAEADAATTANAIRLFGERLAVKLTVA
jgi:TatD DNase family protein